MKRTDAGIFVPQTLKPAKKPIAIVFWYSRKLDNVRIGAPEWFPIPQGLKDMGYEKVVCKTAHEVEHWSQKLRDQREREKQQTDEERERFEGPILAKMRQDLHHQLATGRNQINRDFIRQALEQLDAYEARRRKEKIESFQHVEGFEDGH